MSSDMCVILPYRNTKLATSGTGTIYSRSVSASLESGVNHDTYVYANESVVDLTERSGHHTLAGFQLCYS
jgi:hypothetical protein